MGDGIRRPDNRMRMESFEREFIEQTGVKLVSAKAEWGR